LKPGDSSKRRGAEFLANSSQKTVKMIRLTLWRALPEMERNLESNTPCQPKKLAALTFFQVNSPHLNLSPPIDIERPYSWFPWPSSMTNPQPAFTAGASQQLAQQPAPPEEQCSTTSTGTMVSPQAILGEQGATSQINSYQYIDARIGH
jgi:hypothetical protein